MDRKLMKEVGIKKLFVDAETATKVKMLDEKMKELQKETQVSKRVLKNAETSSHGFLKYAIFAYLLAYELNNTSNAK